MLVVAVAALTASVLLPATALASGSPHSVALKMPSPTRLAGSTRSAPALRVSRQRPPRGAWGAGRLASLGSSAVREQTTTLTGRHPVARTATVNINRVVPPFRFFLNFNVVGPLKLQLLGFLIGPFYQSFELFPLGGCHSCNGHGNFNSVKVFNRRKCGSVPAPCLKETVRGKRTLTKHSLFIQALTSPDQVGRFTVLGVQVNPASPKVRRQGCVGADVPLTNDNFLAYLNGAKTVPTVPCHQTVTTDPLPILSPTPPFEVSSTSPTSFEISGSASGSEWLAMFEGHQPCKLNSQATASVEPTAPRLFTQVSGQFTKVFRTAPDTSPGYLCFYLQTGGTFNGIPDGRVTMADQVVYIAGDTVNISFLSTCQPPQGANWCIQEQFAGSAAVAGEQLWVFAPASPCAATAAQEYAQDPQTRDFPLNTGQFANQLGIYGTASSTYVCAYLNLGAPANGTPTGPTLASAGVLVTGL